MKHIKLLLTLCLALSMLTALAIPAAADVVVSPWEYIVYTPVGWIAAAVLIAVVVLVTVLLIRYFFKKK